MVRKASFFDTDRPKEEADGDPPRPPAGSRDKVVRARSAPSARPGRGAPAAPPEEEEEEEAPSPPPPAPEPRLEAAPADAVAVDAAAFFGVPPADVAEEVAAEVAALAEGDIESDLDSIFESFEKIEEEPEDAARTRKAKSRPADKRVEQVVNTLVRTLTSKKEVNQKDLDVVLEITKNKIVEAVNAQAITVYFLEKDGVHFRHISYSRSLYKGDAAAEKKFQGTIERLKKTVLPADRGIVGRVLRDNRSHHTLDASRDPEYNDEIEKLTGFRVKSMITVPIAYEGEVYGAVQVMNKSPLSGEEFFSQKDIRLVEEVADYSARAIYMARNPGFVWPEEDIARYVARLAKLEYVDLREVEIDGNLLVVIGEENLRKFEILPLKKLGSGTLKAAMSNPLDINRRDSFELATGLRIEVLVVAPSDQIKGAIERQFHKEAITGASEAVLAELAEKQKGVVEKIDVAEDADKNSAPIIQLSNRIIEDAYSRGASDIHLEPYEKEVLVRYRVDGNLEEKLRLPAAALKPLVARLKIMATLNIAESRLPQDGRIMFKEHAKSGLDIDLRVATAPMVWGEKVVMRILDKKSMGVGLDNMGFSEANLARYRRCLAAPYGMILHVGPTGSGKTTTLYAALKELNTPDMNIQTAEDPVEYMLPGINQMQMKQSIGLTFARALKCYLRQDPDIILVGEIRDLETAEIAIEAALTGHQLLSTLHTNDAAGTVTRFVDMGIEPFLISSSLLCVCAQRLMRKVCAHCKERRQATPEEKEMVRVDPAEFCELVVAKKGGCARCNGAGYKGRMGVHELMVMNDELREICTRHGATAADIDKVARKNGMVSLFDDAMEKVRAGVTSLEEALRTVRVEKI
jgi:type IV pilus assembly protein PilB